MRRLNKILIISLITSLGIINQSIAATASTEEDSDCRDFGVLTFVDEWSFKIVTESRNTTTNKYSNFLTINEQNAIIDNQSLNTAILNLKKYCCENEKWWLSQTDETCMKDRWVFNANALESPYLFDHIFDVMMRRLAWLKWEKHIYEYTNMTTDDKWTEWRERISGVAENPAGSTPQLIINEYKKYRKQSVPGLGFNIASKIYASFWDNEDEIFLKYISWQWDSEESKNIAKAIKKYNERTLYDRYVNACAMSEYFYSLLHSKFSKPDRETTVRRVSNWVCNNAVQTQINAENAYVKLVIQQSSNLFLLNYIQWYMNYLRGRADVVKQKQQKIKDGLLAIARQVPEIISECVH